MKLVILSSTAILLAALPAAAATVTSVDGSFVATFMASDPSTLMFEIDGDDDTSMDEGGDATASASAVAADGTIDGTLSATTDATGPGYGSAQASGEASRVFFAENLGADPLTLSFSVGYSLEALITSDLLADDDGAAMIQFIVFANGDEIFSDALDADLGAPGMYDASNTYDFNLDLAGFDFADVEFFLAGETFATATSSVAAPAPVPLPASGLLLLAGLGGLAAARRRLS